MRHGRYRPPQDDIKYKQALFLDAKVERLTLSIYRHCAAFVRLIRQFWLNRSRLISNDRLDLAKWRLACLLILGNQCRLTFTVCVWWHILYSYTDILFMVVTATVTAFVCVCAVAHVVCSACMWSSERLLCDQFLFECFFLFLLSFIIRRIGHAAMIHRCSSYHLHLFGCNFRLSRSCTCMKSTDSAYILPTHTKVISNYYRLIKNIFEINKSQIKQP